jgi:3D (Asp-Asp-Asp) domain-containing protein
MRIPFVKSPPVNIVFSIVLGFFAFSFWLDLRLIQGETRAFETERDFLAVKLQEIRKAGILFEEEWQGISEIRMIKATAYSSTPDQTDQTPFVTAAGTYVRDGVVATNLLPFGTKIRLRELFGTKVFTVEDRMARDDAIDVWFPTREEALAFGTKSVKMEILKN